MSAAPMMRLSDAAAAVGGRLRGADAPFCGVSTDSRSIARGELFVALVGERFDGHDFLPQAAQAGAAGALVRAGRVPEGELPLVEVGDTRLALGALAAHWRTGIRAPLAALTGSNGKTTVKEMTAAILRAACGDDAAVLATRGNLNNDIGMPLTLLAVRPRHRYAVLEMGMNHPGEIAYMTRIARPDAALVNNAQAAHLEGLGSIEAVARAKGEIFEGLASAGTAVINADDPHAPLWRRLAAGRRVLEFGLAQGDVSARYTLQAEGAELSLRTPSGEVATRLHVPGEHNVRNACAAAALALAVGAPLAAVGAGLARFRGVPGRLARVPAIGGGLLVDDTYNANPGSVRAAIDVLAAAAGTRVLVLGDMGELGPAGAALHREIGQVARAAGVQRLLALGELTRSTVAAFGEGGRHFERIEDLLAELENLLAPGVTVLVKGSRFMQMERVVNGLAASAAVGAGH